MARRYGADDIVEAVDALSDLFRAGFSANHELGTVESEFQHIESYLKIQKLRYHDILDYTLNMDPQTSQLPVMRTILQPIVENALYHGIKENDQPGRIEIVSRLEENSLILEVSDNGRGLTESQLEQLTAAIQRSDDMDFSSSHGLYNVQQRLRLSYGPDYGLSIQSKPNEGTRVTVRRPVMPPGHTPGAEQKQD
jgi:two-component system sensor histidine kinase YesM